MRTAFVVLFVASVGCGHASTPARPQEHGGTAALAPRADTPPSAPNVAPCGTTRGYVVDLSPQVADSVCTSSRQLVRASDGTKVDIEATPVDNCGAAAFVAVLRNCSDRSVSIDDVAIDVVGRRPDLSGYVLAESTVPPGREARVPVRTLGVGEVTVTFRLHHDGANELARGHARARLVSTTVYE